MNPKNKIEELFHSIKESTEYKEYIKITEKIDKNKEIKEIVNHIKKLQQEAVNLEYKKNIKYKEINKQAEQKIKELNTIPLYKEYTRRINALNDILAESSNQIEKYINSKI